MESSVSINQYDSSAATPAVRSFSPSLLPSPVFLARLLEVEYKD